MKMNDENVANIAIVKGFIHSIALPLILTVALSNIFIGLAWIMFVSYLYTRVFKDKPAAYWFFGFAKGMVVFFLIFMLIVLASTFQ